MSIDNPRCCYCWSSKKEDEKENDNSPYLEKQHEKKMVMAVSQRNNKKMKEKIGNGHG